MKVIIIDDENKARRLISTLLTENCSDITLQLEANDLKNHHIIKQHQTMLIGLKR